MRFALLLVLGFLVVGISGAGADVISEAQKNSSEKICKAKYDSLAKLEKKKAKRIEADGNENLILNVCFLRSFNAGVKCHEGLLAKASGAAKGLADKDAIHAEMTKLTPGHRACLLEANEEILADTEVLFGLYGRGKEAEGKALVDGWIKDGSANTHK